MVVAELSAFCCRDRGLGLLYIYGVAPGEFTRALAAALLVLATVVTLAVLAATARALVARNGILVAQDKWGPISLLINVTHGVFRRSFMMMNKFLAEKLEADPSDKHVAGKLQKRFVD